WQSPIAKFFSDPEREEIVKITGAKSGDLILFIADNDKVVHDSLSNLLLLLSAKLQLVDHVRYSLVWVVDFTLLEFDPGDKRYVAQHHLFTVQIDGDLPILEPEPMKVRSKAYDLALNGMEVGGGSIRIHQVELQRRILALLGIGREEAEAKFGFLLEALS